MPQRIKKSQKMGKMKIPPIIRRLSPPQYDANTTVSRIYRFINSGSAGSFVITACKLGALQTICTTTNSVVTQLFEAVRVRRIEVWASPVVATPVPVNVSCIFAGSALGVAGNDITVSDMSIGTTRPAYICAIPPRNSQASQWQSCDTTTGSNTFFRLVLPAGAVIDVHLSLRTTNDTRSTNNTVTVVTGVLTTMYYLALDNGAGGTGATGNILTPDPSLVTTI